MILESTGKVLAKCMLKYCRISECMGPLEAVCLSVPIQNYRVKPPNDISLLLSFSIRLPLMSFAGVCRLLFKVTK